MKTNEAVITGERKPLGYFQWTPTGAASTLAAQITATMKTLMAATGTVPGYAVIQQNVASATIRWRDDGIAPTAAIGMVLGTAELDYAGSIYDFQAIVSTGSPVLDVSLYA